MTYYGGYDYLTDLANEAKAERKRMKNNTPISDRGWATAGGSAILPTSSTADLYNSIRYTVGKEVADNFIKNF